MDTGKVMEARLPSTGSLRVFVEAARLGSTMQASDAVHLSQSAVSKQIKLLEEVLGATLFTRTPQGLVLTEQGMIFRPYAEAALEQIARGRRRLAERHGERRPVRLHMLAIVGERWLMARFPEFNAAHPDIDVQFTHYVSENETEEPDLDIRHGDGAWPGHEARYLFGREMAFVCAPSFLERHGGALSAADMQRLTMLQHFQMPAYWAEFTEAHGVRGTVPAHTIRYGYMSVIVKAAVAGLGFALMPRCFIREELSDGTLCELSHLRFNSASGYWLTRPEDGGARPEVDVLAAWLRQQADAFSPA
jgi:LysR family transcriptional regulator, glycine cleavage system transcriptional activator